MRKITLLSLVILVPLCGFILPSFAGNNPTPQAPARPGGQASQRPGSVSPDAARNATDRASKGVDIVLKPEGTKNVGEYFLMDHEGNIRSGTQAEAGETGGCWGNQNVPQLNGPLLCCPSDILDRLKSAQKLQCKDGREPRPLTAQETVSITMEGGSPLAEMADDCKPVVCDQGCGGQNAEGLTSNRQTNQNWAMSGDDAKGSAAEESAKDKANAAREEMLAEIAKETKALGEEKTKAEKEANQLAEKSRDPKTSKKERGNAIASGNIAMDRAAKLGKDIAAHATRAARIRSVIADSRGSKYKAPGDWENRFVPADKKKNLKRDFGGGVSDPGNHDNSNDIIQTAMTSQFVCMTGPNSGEPLPGAGWSFEQGGESGQGNGSGQRGSNAGNPSGDAGGGGGMAGGPQVGDDVVNPGLNFDGCPEAACPESAQTVTMDNCPSGAASIVAGNGMACSRWNSSRGVGAVDPL